MPLVEEFESSGRFLFRWRSYLPLVLLSVVGASLVEFRYPGGSHVLDTLWEMLCLLVSLSGLAVRAVTVGYASAGTSGRNTRRQVADSLNTTGPYSLVRHPLYLGNFLMALGVFLFLRVWWLPLVYSLAFALYYERIMFAEEAFLRGKFGVEYIAWAVGTPAFVPGRSRWRAPGRPFAWRTVAKRESQSLAAVCIAMFVLEVLGDIRHTGAVIADPIWVWITASSILLYAMIRILRKTTRILDAGRHSPAPEV
ncbi:MAG: isoprenylcysteine carboxylmethyltransferase family protein [Candidatus Fermentibacter sp.]|nr:isoprenylcysteine carboxylmethyltransferase family protein [Candidatus Fermentibacter sp.]